MDVLIELTVASLCGWGYLLSPSFREWTEQRWASQRQMRTAVEIMAGAAGVLVSLGLAGYGLYRWLG